MSPISPSYKDCGAGDVDAYLAGMKSWVLATALHKPDVVTYTHDPKRNPQTYRTEAGMSEVQGQPQPQTGSRLALARGKTNLGSAAEITHTAQCKHLKSPKE